MSPRIRLHVDQPFAPGQALALPEAQAHYLVSVMRQGEGAEIRVFNGRDGEWAARIARAGRRAVELALVGQTAPLRRPPDLWLMFAPIKKARTDFIVEKAAELGAARILPVQTDFTNAERIRQDRLQAHAVEAAEQCGGTFVPEVAELQPLARWLAGWDPARRLLWCDEALAGAATVLAGEGVVGPGAETGRGAEGPGPWAILIGPEGGFSEGERRRLSALPFVRAASLGPRILRADTAAVAALTLWQAALGDWR